MTESNDLKLSEDIPQTDQNLYLKQNKEVLGLSEFTNNYVKQVLEEENKQEFELMKGYVEYQKIVQKAIGKKVNIKIVEKLILGQSLEEFKKFLQENKEVVSLIKYGKEENLNKVWGLFKIKTKEDLIELSKNKEVIYLIKWGRKENFKQLFELEGFDKEILIELAKNEKVVKLIEKGREENLNRVWKLLKIKTKEDLLDLVENEKYIHFLKAIINNDIKTIKELYNINNKNNYNINIGYGTLPNLGGCSAAEENNFNILYNYLYEEAKIFKIGDDIIGYIKLVGEETFLSFKDIFDKKGNLIFKKGWIYTVSIENKNNKEEYIHLDDIFKNRSIDISKIEGFKRYPIRKIKAFHNEKLHKNFDELVGNFIEGYNNYKNK